MNKFQLLEYTPDRFVYLYKPEGRGDWGEIIYEFSNNATKITRRASENSAWHDNHALQKIEEIAKKRNLPIEFTQAWY